MEVIVNGEKIPSSLIEQETRRLRTGAPELNEKKVAEKASEQLVGHVLLRQEAERKFPDVPAAEVEEEYNKLIAQHGGAKAFFKQYNLTPKDEPAVMQDLARQIKVDRIIEEIVRPVRKPEEDEIRARFEENPEKFRFEETVKASHIVKAPEGPDAGSVYNQMVEIRQKLLEGADFAATADEYSGCNDRGGDLGSFARGRMVEEFDIVVFSMNAGEISPVFKTQFGYHIAKVFEREPARQKSFMQAKEEIYREILDGRREAAVSTWIKERKAESTVVIKE